MSASPNFNYLADDGSIHQLWFDNPRSLELKMAAAAAAGLRGVGFWNYDMLDYFGDRGGGEAGVQQARDMWGAVRAFTGAAAAPSS
jgi:di-N-acetylchitobiase